MEIYKALMELIERPNAIRPYKLLQKLYLERGQARESSAFGEIIEKRFSKNANATDNSSSHQE